jgi:hypothetical protein
LAAGDKILEGMHEWNVWLSSKTNCDTPTAKDVLTGRGRDGLKCGIGPSTHNLNR